MDVRDLLPYEGKLVDVGMPHFNEPGRTFFRMGILEKVNKSFVKLRHRNGLQIIRLGDIIEIRDLGGRP